MPLPLVATALAALVRSARSGASALAALATLMLGVAVLPAVAHADKPEVTVLSKGSGKKRVLQLAPKKGLTQTVDMKIAMGMEMNMSGMAMPAMKMPTMTMAMQSEVTEIRGNGDIVYAFELTEAGITDDEGVMEDVKSGMLAEMNKMVGLKGTTVVTPDGHTVEADFVMPEGAEPEMSDQLKKTVDYSGVPLPTEAVGKGAKWQVAQDVAEQGMKLSQVTTYELTELSGDIATLTITIDQKADPQSLKPEGLPPGGTAELVSFDSKGTGTSVLDLSKLLPTDSTVAIDMASEMKMQADGQTMNVGMNMDMKMEMNER